MVTARSALGLILTTEPVTVIGRSEREGPDGALYCDGHGGMTARFDRHAAVQLADLILEDDTGPYFDVNGERVRPPVVEDPIR